MKRSSFKEFGIDTYEEEVEISKPLTEDTAEIIAELFAGDPGLNTVQIRVDRECVTKTVQHITLLQLKNLTNLQLDENHLGRHGPDTAHHVSLISTLIEVNLYNNNLGRHGPMTVQHLTTLPNLTTLALDSNYLCQYGPETAERAAKIPNLNTLGLCSNNLGRDGPMTVQHLTTHPNLTTLYLDSNYLRQYGPETAERAAKIPNLATLGLRSNDLKEHALSTAEALAASNSIRAVHLYGNQIFMDDAIKIAKIFACRENPIKLGIEPEAHEHIRKAISEINAEMHPYLNSAMEPFIPPELPKLLGLMQEYADPYYIEFMD